MMPSDFAIPFTPGELKIILDALTHPNGPKHFESVHLSLPEKDWTPEDSSQAVMHLCNTLVHPNGPHLTSLNLEGVQAMIAIESVEKRHCVLV